MAPGKGARMVESFSFFSDSFSLASLDTKSAFRDRKSTRLNSSHSQISYAVFCLKKKMHHSRHPHVSVLLEELPLPPGRRGPAGSSTDPNVLRPIGSEYALVVELSTRYELPRLFT